MALRTSSGGLYFSNVSAAARAPALVDEVIRAIRLDLMSSQVCSSGCAVLASDLVDDDASDAGESSLLEQAEATATTQSAATTSRTGFTYASWCDRARSQ
jgi:hypothetical protein